MFDEHTIYDNISLDGWHNFYHILRIKKNLFIKSSPPCLQLHIVHGWRNPQKTLPFIRTVMCSAKKRPTQLHNDYKTSDDLPVNENA